MLSEKTLCVFGDGRRDIMICVVGYRRNILVVQFVPLGAEEAVVVVQNVGMVESAVLDGLIRAA
ncbi:MAG: hypothetical protein ACYTE3_27540 [Planctomycetota bacterium]